MNLSQFTHETVLRDGSSIHIRAIKPNDKQRLIDAFYRFRCHRVAVITIRTLL